MRSLMEASSSESRTFAFDGDAGGRRAVRVAFCIRQAAALVGEEIDQAAHAREIGRVVDVAAFALRRDEPRTLQLLQVEGQRGRRQAELLDEIARRIAFRSALHEQPEDRQARLLRQSAERADGFVWFHSSKSIEMTKICKGVGRWRGSGYLATGHAELRVLSRARIPQHPCTQVRAASRLALARDDA